MIEPNSKWTHKREGYAVRIADIGGGLPAMVKDANDAQWQVAVGYYREEQTMGAVFIRAEADFLAKFSPNEEQEP